MSTFGKILRIIFPNFSDRLIRHRACALRDTAYAIIKEELDEDFEQLCEEIQESRKKRGREMLEHLKMMLWINPFILCMILSSGNNFQILSKVVAPPNMHHLITTSCQSKTLLLLVRKGRIKSRMKS